MNNSMTKVTFSIIIPVYNVEKYLKECVDSVLNQTYQQFEILLINDGSQDSSGRICDYYAMKDSRVRVIHQKNQGHVCARSKGIEMSNGEYCLFLDSDDYWDNSLLQTVKSTFDKYNCDVVLFGYKKVSNKGELIFKSKPLFKNDTIINEKNKRYLFDKIIDSSKLNNLVCKAVKKTLIEKEDFTKYRNVKNGEDLLQSLPILYKSKKTVYIDEHLYNYRTVPTSITNTLNENFLNDLTIVRTITFNYIKKMNMLDKSLLARYYHFAIDSILGYVTRVSISHLETEKKKKIIATVNKNQLYQESLNYLTCFNLPLKRKLVLFMLKYEMYGILVRILKAYNLLKPKIR